MCVGQREREKKRLRLLLLWEKKEGASAPNKEGHARQPTLNMQVLSKSTWKQPQQFMLGPARESLIPYFLASFCRSMAHWQGKKSRGTEMQQENKKSLLIA